MPDLELKTLLEKQGKAFESFKKSNDQRLDQIELNGKSDPVLDQKVDKANEDITAILKQIDELQAKMNRPGGNGKDADSEEVTAHKKAYRNFLRKGVEDGLSDLESKALNVGVDAEGGFAVPEELDRNVLSLMKNESPMRQECEVIAIGSAKYKKLVDIGGTTSGWVGEETARGETNTPQLAEITPFMGEIYANPAATQQMLDDSFFDPEAWLTNAVSEKFSEEEAIAFLSGDGTNKPKGILAYASASTADSVRAFGTLQHLVTAGATSITGDELITLVYSMKKALRQNAKWMMNSLTMALIRKLKDTEGNYLWQPGLQVGQPASLVGYGIADNEDMADATATNVSAMFGNFKRGYIIVDRMGIRTLRDPYTNKPFVHFYTTKRVGGMVQDSEAIKLLQQAA